MLMKGGGGLVDSVSDLPRYAMVIWRFAVCLTAHDLRFTLVLTFTREHSKNGSSDPHTRQVGRQGKTGAGHNVAHG